MIWLAEWLAGKLLTWAACRRLHRRGLHDAHEAHHILAGLEAADTTGCTFDCPLWLRPPMKRDGGKER